jgi:DNA polymerase III alpha subunit (gram-positive type)
MEHAKFVHLHLHSQYSLLDGAIKIGELVNRVRDLKMPAVADRSGVELRGRPLVGSAFGAAELQVVGQRET